MNRQILEACLPYFLLLAAGFVVARVLLGLSGAKWRFQGFKQLNRCEEGSVQSLALVMTLPLFLMVVMFIVQMAHLMVGVLVVNYAAFAAARSAIVWIPAQVGEPTSPDSPYNSPNRLLPTMTPGSSSTGTGTGANGVILSGSSQELTYSRKCQEIFSSAALACAIISPTSSRFGYTQTNPMIPGLVSAIQNTYQTIIPASTSNTKINQRLQRKVSYSCDNTFVTISFQNLDSEKGPTYNPIGHKYREYQPSEIGWQDPVTVTVSHNFALFPGAGRFIAAIRNKPPGSISGAPDEVQLKNGIFQTSLTASVQLTNEGLKSVREHQQSFSQLPYDVKTSTTTTSGLDTGSSKGSGGGATLSMP
jgi:hypothetical protein